MYSPDRACTEVKDILAQAKKFGVFLLPVKLYNRINRAYATGNLIAMDDNLRHTKSAYSKQAYNKIDNTSQDYQCQLLQQSGDGTAPRTDVVVIDPYSHRSPKVSTQVTLNFKINNRSNTNTSITRLIRITLFQSKYLHSCTRISGYILLNNN